MFMFETGVLSEEFPQTRERGTRMPLIQDAQKQEAAPAADVAAEAEPLRESLTQDEQAAEALLASAAFAQVLEKATGRPVGDIAAALANGEAVKA